MDGPSFTFARQITAARAPSTLPHLPLDRMAAILADDICKCIFLNEKDKIPIQISLKLVPRGPIDNKPALVQVMVWRRAGDKPLPKPMMAQFTDAYMRHMGGDELISLYVGSHSGQRATGSKLVLCRSVNPYLLIFWYIPFTWTWL